MITQHSEDNPIGHVTSPIVTGGAIIALKFDKGVIVATDTLLSYGGLLSISVSMQSTPASTATSRSQRTSSLLRRESTRISKRRPGDYGN
jgi:hypothetical protein